MAAAGSGGAGVGFGFDAVVSAEGCFTVLLAVLAADGVNVADFACSALAPFLAGCRVACLGDCPALAVTIAVFALGADGCAIGAGSSVTDALLASRPAALAAVA